MPLGARSGKPPGAHAAFALHLDLAALLQHEVALEEALRAFAQLDSVGLAMRLHARRGVDRVAPQVVAELVLADDAGHDRPDFDTDAQAQREALFRVVPGE